MSKKKIFFVFNGKENWFVDKKEGQHYLEGMMLAKTINKKKKRL